MKGRSDGWDGYHPGSNSGKNPVTSMIGKSQGETEIALDFYLSWNVPSVSRPKATVRFAAKGML
jgi:hypothetical protein